MQKRICFTLNTEKDKEVLAVLERIPQCLRGSFIKVAIVLDIDVEKDKEIFQQYPDFLNNPMRYDIIKALLLKQQGNQVKDHATVEEKSGNFNDNDKGPWTPPVVSFKYNK